MLQEVVVIVDRSGSMAGKEDDTIGGINTMINTLKSENVKKEDSKLSMREKIVESNKQDQINLSIKFFDHEEILFYNSVNIYRSQLLNKTDFAPRGQTALHDAIGNTIKYFIKNKKTKKYDSCNIYVATDGYENCSKKFNSDSLKKLIEEAEEYNINLYYLGANQDAILEAGKIGILPDRAINYAENKDAVEAVYRSVASTANRARVGENSDFTALERAKSLAQS